MALFSSALFAGAALGGGVAQADALSTPSMTAPLSANPNPFSFDGGPVGKVYVGGAVTGLGLAQTNRVPGDNTDLFDVSNGQVFLQTTSGPVQFFIEAGAYSFPALGTPYFKAGNVTDHTYSALPVAYVKFQPTAEISVQVGKLPTLIGAEYAFTFQNLNIERGLLWNQEPVVSKGVQANYAKGPITVSVSVNDGFYSNHYNWFSGLASYAFTANDTLAVDGGTTFSSTDKSTFSTPLAQNNGDLLNVSFTHTVGPLTVNPYFQYTHVPTDGGIGLYTAASTYSGAVLAKYTFTPVFSVGARAEYVSSSSDACHPRAVLCVPTNLLYGPGSNAFSITVTPTYQNKLFFVRGEVSYVRAGDSTAGFAFGSNFSDTDQFRGLVETGFIF